MPLSKGLFDEKIMVLGLEASDVNDALKKLSTRLYEEGYAKESFIQAVQDREKEFPTGLPTEGVGVAIPHTDVIHVNKEAVAVAVLKNPVTFQMMGMPEVNVSTEILFMLALKEPHGQIEMLEKLMGVLQDTDLLFAIKESQSIYELKELLINKFNLE